jgi:hypothetical protein
MSNSNASATKRGPGRFHKQGHQKASQPKVRGASFDFVLHTNPMKAARRETKRGLGGHRQWKRREYLSMHGVEYAAKHPTIAARYAF